MLRTNQFWSPEFYFWDQNAKHWISETQVNMVSKMLKQNIELKQKNSTAEPNIKITEEVLFPTLMRVPSLVDTQSFRLERINLFC